jgi:o-succinylbenzoate---CoA ligase
VSREEPGLENFVIPILRRAFMVRPVEVTLPANTAFWNDPAPAAAGDFPGALDEMKELAGQVLFETSGSTGEPKWIAISKQALLVSAEAVNAHLEVGADACWGLALPIRHVGGFGVVARAYCAGCGFHEFGERWNAAAFGDWVRENKVTHSSLVPTQLHDLVAAGIRAPELLRAVVVGGGHLNAETGQTARGLGWPVLASYGMTEAASQIATQPMSALNDIYQPSPIPLLPIWSAGLTENARLKIRGQALFSGWVERSGPGWVFRRRDGDAYETRDRVEIGPGGLTPLGRSDGMVKVLGELVDPAVIEREIIGLSGGRLRPDVLVVVALPDERAGHILVPVTDAAEPPGPVEETLAIYQKSAPGFRRLQPIQRLADFPRSPLGKALRRKITDRLDGENSSGSTVL